MTSTSKVTTLFNLKDEYLKAKLETRSSESAQPSGKRKKLKDIINYKKEEKDKKSLEKAAKEKKRAARLALTEAEANDLARSRSVLEAKSAVYDKLSRQVDDVSTSVLVDFSQKKPQDNTGASIAFDYNATSRRNYSQEDGPEVEEIQGPDEIHFANVDHGEVRSKGVGFYSFSDDPLTRTQQMDFLKSMRDSTERSRELYLTAKNKRRQEKVDRLNRIRKRMNLEPIERLPNEKDETEQVEAPLLEENTIMPSANTVPTENIAKTIEEKFLKREKTLWEKKVDELRGEREINFAPTYTPNQQRDVAQEYRMEEEEEEINEEDDAIVNFISFVRRNT